MSSSLPSYTDPAPEDGVVRRLSDLVAAAHALWTSPEERRRTRAFGFRPAVEPGVLKRDWRGLQVRVSAEWLRARDIDGDALEFHDGPGEPVLIHNGEPLRAENVEAPIVATLLDLVGSYERWVEAREGRQERMSRIGRSEVADRRQVNALAEARRLQRMLHLSAPRRR